MEYMSANAYTQKYVLHNNWDFFHMFEDDWNFFVSAWTEGWSFFCAWGGEAS